MYLKRCRAIEEENTEKTHHSAFFRVQIGPSESREATPLISSDTIFFSKSAHRQAQLPRTRVAAKREYEWKGKTAVSEQS
jgi:hypothetical protein